MCFAPQRRAFLDVSTSKSGPDLVCFVHLASKRASRHNGVHFFDISTSKSGPSMVRFVHFDIFTSKCASRFYKFSEAEVLCMFLLRNVHRGTVACTFSTSQLPKMLWTWCVFIFSPANVLRATTACTFPSLMLGSWLRTRRFSERPTFRPSGAFATFLPFRAPGSSFFWDFLFCDLLSSSSLLFSDSSSHLCFSPVLLFICPYCLKFDF